MNAHPLVNITNPTEIDVYKVVGDDVIERWRALGDAIDNAQYLLGREAQSMIEYFDELPAYKNAVYIAIGKTAGKSAQSIRKYYYTVRDIPQELWGKYETVPFSAFGHAAKFDNCEEVLKYALENACSIEELKSVFPLALETHEKTKTQNEYPPQYRRIVADAKLYDVLDDVAPMLNEIQRIIEGAKSKK
ncbi:MAG: hypothetical protein IT310_04880, partial [Anaerolineales bacterium]|nr:hypothetical protein [Anaerolineales bacterium]